MMFDEKGRLVVNAPSTGGAGVSSVSVYGYTPLTGDVTFSAGCGIYLTQCGQNIEITACGGGCGGGAPGGSNGSIQVNCSGTTFFGDSYFLYDQYSHSMTLGQNTVSNCSNYSIIHGSSDNSNEIVANGGTGNYVAGYSTGCGNIQTQCSVSGAHVFGVAAYSSNIYAAADATQAFGRATNSASIIVYTYGGFAHGLAESGQIICYGEGAEASGYATACGTIQTTSAPGGKAFGKADGSYSAITAQCAGSLSHGMAYNMGQITAAEGCHAHGNASNCSYIYAGAVGSRVGGYVTGNAYLESTAVASNVWGTADGLAAHISSSGYGGNWAGGYALGDYSEIESTGGGSGAFGYVTNGAAINATGFGAWAFGSADYFASILAQAQGAIAAGVAYGSGTQLTAQGLGSRVGGYAICGGYIGAVGNASISEGYSTNSSSLLTASGVASRVLGIASGGNISAGSDATRAEGIALNGDIYASSNAATARGYTNGYGITATGIMASAQGTGINGVVQALGDRAWAWGDNVISNNTDCYSWGNGFQSNDANSFNIGFGSQRFQVNADNLLLQAGLSSGLIAKVGGKLSSAYADVGNSTTTETDLYSYTVPAQTLSVDGAGISAFYSVNILGSATATSQFKVYFGGTAYFDSTALPLTSNGNWQLWVEVVRASSSTARISTTLQSPGATLPAYTNEADVTGLDFTATNVLKLTGKRAGVGAASDDILFKQGKVIFEA